MIDDTGIFRTTIEVAAPGTPDRRRALADVMVDTRSEYNWIPAGLLVEIGVAPVRIDRFQTGDGDMVLLGAIGLEGLNLRVDLVLKELVPAGPVPVAGLRAA